MRPIAFAAASLIAVLPCCASQEQTATPLAAVAAPAMADPLLLEQVPADAQMCVAWNVLEHPGYAGSRWEKFNALSQREPVTVDSVRETLQKTIAFCIKEGAKTDPNLRDTPQLRDATALICDILAVASVHGGTLYMREFNLHRKIGNIEMEGPSVPTMVLLIHAPKEGPPLLETWNKRVPRDGIGQVFKADLQNGVFRLAFSMNPEPWVKPAASLAKDPRFLAATGGLGAKPAMLVYADAENLVARLKEYDAWQKKTRHGRSDIAFEKLDAVTGISGLKSLAFGGGFAKDGQWQWNALVGAPTPRKGVLAMMDGAAVSPELLKRVPASAESFTAAGFDAGATIEAILALAAHEEPNARRDWNQTLANAKGQTGIDVNALLAGLGTQWLAFSDPMATGGGLSGTVVVSPLRNAPAVESNLNQAITLATMLIKQQMAKENNPLSVGFLADTFRGVTIRRLGFPLLSPGYAVQGDTLYASLLPQAIQGAVQPGQKSLTDSPAYRLLAAQVVPAGASPRMLSYSDLPRRAPHTYGNGLLLNQYGLGMMEMFTGEPAPMSMPLLRDLLPVLSPDLSAAWTDAQGLHLRSQGPFPSATLISGEIDGTVIASTALMAGILVPVLGKAKQNANVMKENVNARNVEAGAAVYAISNKDYYPGWTPRGKRMDGNLSGLTYMLQESSAVPAQLTSLAHVAPACPITEGFLKGTPEDMKAVDAWVRANSGVIFIPDIRSTYLRPGQSRPVPCIRSEQDYQCIVAFTDSATTVDPRKAIAVHGDCATETITRAELDALLQAQYGATSDELTAEFRAGKAPPELLAK